MAVLISIVVGLGVTRILSGLASLFEHRDTIRLDGLAVAWAANILLLHIVFWWASVGTLRARSTWTLEEFVVLFLYATVIFFMASLILPETCSEGLDLRARYESIRRPLFASGFLFVFFEVFDTVLRGGWHRVFVEMGPPYVGLLVGALMAFGAGIVSSNRRLHWLIVIALIVANLAWVVSRFGQL